MEPKYKIKHKVLEDSKGNMSSKRLVGAISFALGAAGAIYLYIISAKAEAGDADTMLSIINSFFYLGGTLIGSSVLEGFKISIGNKK